MMFSLNPRVVLFATLVSMVGSAVVSARADQRTEVAASRVAELVFTAQHDRSIEGNVELDVLFTTPDERVLPVPAFWAGGKTWKCRYASRQIGAHTFVTRSSDPTDSGLHEQAGTVEVTPYSGGNRLYRHGPLRVSANRRHFEHADGTPFLWLGDTWWMGLSKRLRWPDDVRQLAADRKQKGFNVIQIVGGLPPDLIPFDERGEGDGGQAWSPNFGRIRPEFYNQADRRIEHLVDQELVPCIVGAWKQYMPVMGPEKMNRHWRNLIARYGAYPVVWVLGGEINSPGYGAAARADLPQAVEATPDAIRDAWTQVARYLRETDPYDRILGAHNVASYHVLDDPTLLDMYFLQTGHSSLGSIAAQHDWFSELWDADHRAPLVMSEGNYQWLFNEGSYGDALQRFQYWSTMLDGGAGHTYGANGIWQVNQPDQPFGSSPHGFVWGNTPWNVAAQHAASRQLGIGKQTLSELPWTELSPSRGIVEFDLPDLLPIESTKAKWMRPPNQENRGVVMGTSLELPESAKIRRATLRLATETMHALSINGQVVQRRAHKLDYDPKFKHAEAWTLPLAGMFLQPGRNVILLRFHEELLESASPVVLADLTVELEDGQQLHRSLNDWRYHYPEIGWPGDILKLDPVDWDEAVEVNNAMPAPQSLTFRTVNPFGPRCAVADDRLWIIYVPDAVDVRASSLTKLTQLKATRVNPRTGERTVLADVTTDERGSCELAAPRQGGDWLLILRR